MESLILFLVICVLVVWGYKWLALSEVSTPAPPVVLDKNNMCDVAESLCIQEQNRSGRELNGFGWKGE